MTGRERSLLDFFSPGEGGLVSLIGAGGKTTLMRHLALEAAQRGRSVMVTTTTRIRPLLPSSRFPVVTGTPSPELVSNLQVFLERNGIVTYAKRWIDGAKLAGISETDIEWVLRSIHPSLVLVEADGAAGRSLKFHEQFEPVVPDGTSVLIIVAGADIFEAPLTDRTVHRARLFSKKLDIPLGAPITEKVLLKLFEHPEGYLKAAAPAMAVDSRPRTYLYFSKVRGEHEVGHITSLLPALGDMKRFEGIAGGEIGDEKTAIRFFGYHSRGR